MSDTLIANEVVRADEQKRPRLYFGKRHDCMEAPPLLEVQVKSYEEFLQRFIASELRDNTGLHAAFSSVFPISSYTGSAELEYVSYSLGNHIFDKNECISRGLTFAVPLRVKVRLKLFDKEAQGENRVCREIKEQEVYMG